jgi:drug/metabolite transporter (DMT)-like permease
MTYRSLIGIVVVLLIDKWAGTLHQVTRQHMRLHLVRNTSHFIGQNLWFYAVTVITLPQLFAFEFSVPLWVALFAPFFLAERLTATRLVSALIGFLGILIVARPDQLGLSPGIIAAALSALGFTGSAIATKLLTRSQSTTCIMFWLTLMQAILGLICAGYDGDIALPSAETLPWVILVGLAGLFAHFCITSALQIAPAIIVFPMDFVRLPLAAVVGILLYNEPLEVAVFLGAAIILAANFYNIRAEQRNAVKV